MYSTVPHYVCTRVCVCVFFAFTYRRKQNVEEFHELIEGFSSGNLLSPVTHQPLKNFPLPVMSGSQYIECKTVILSLSLSLSLSLYLLRRL